MLTEAKSWVGGTASTKGSVPGGQDASCRKERHVRVAVGGDMIAQWCPKSTSVVASHRPVK